MSIRFTLVVWIVFACTAIAPPQKNERRVAGWLELAVVSPANVELRAKLDTGADFSSLSATNISPSGEKGREQVTFQVMSRVGALTEMTLPVKRYATIKRAKGQVQRRPVVRLGICVGETYMETDVNLVDRSQYGFPLLIGRDFLAAAFVVNPAEVFTLQPNCG